MDAPQLRAARALLNWSQSDLVERSGISKKTIADFELGLTRPHQKTMAALLRTFEAVGIEFIRGGVRLGSKRRQRRIAPE
jgi:transcriptional regulator with XRE-family HTH domain